MSGHPNKLALFSLGAAAVVLASLGLSAPGSLGRNQDEKAAKHTPVAAIQEGILLDHAASKVAIEKGGCACGGQGEHACCSGAPGTCACDQRVERDDRVGPQLLVRVDEVQKEKGKKEEKMASAEAKAKGVATRNAILVHQRALMNDEVWSCCIKPGCAFCQTAGDMCPCAKNLASGGPVCPECWGGWQAGTGRLEGIDAKKVKILPDDKLKMMYGMRAKNFEKVTRGEDKK